MKTEYGEEPRNVFAENPFGTISAAHTYLKFLKRIRGHYEKGYTRVQWHWAKPAQTLTEFRAEVQRALNERIWLKGNPPLHWRKLQPDYEIDLFRDKVSLDNRVQRRIRIYQFNTPEMKARFGHLLSEWND